MKSIISVIFLLAFSDLYSQITEANFSLNKVRDKPIPISQKHLKQLNPAFPIRNIEIIDGRFDEALGYFKNVNVPEYLKFEIKTTDEIKNYFTSHFKLISTDTAYTLLCIVKKLLLSNNIYEAENGKLDNTKNNILIRSGGLIKFEFFAAIDGLYIPLYRFDSTITGSQRITVSTAPEYLSEILTASLNKLETIKWNVLKAKARRVSKQTIDSSISQAFDFLLYKTPVKGFYKNFTDFINNNPVATEYSIAKTDKADFLYIKDSKNNDVLQTDIWGYCDGKDYFIYAAENFFKLYPTGKTFMIYGAKDYKNVRFLRIHFGLLDVAMPNSAFAKSKTRSRYALFHETFILDMETGELF